MRPVKNRVKYQVWERLGERVDFLVQFRLSTQSGQGIGKVPRFAMGTSNPYRMVQLRDGVWHHVRDQVRENL